MGLLLRGHLAVLAECLTPILEGRFIQAELQDQIAGLERSGLFGCIQAFEGSGQFGETCKVISYLAAQRFSQNFSRSKDR